MRPYRYKRYKIRRYGKIYRGSRRPPTYERLRLVLGVVAILVVAFIGWNISGPVMDFLSGAMEAHQPVSSAAALPPSSSVPAPAPQPEPEPEPEFIPPAFSQLNAVYLPPETVANSMQLAAALEELEGSQVNAVLVDLKDTDGLLLYQSRLEQVEQAGAQAPDAWDLRELARTLEEREIALIGRMACFQDPIAASRIDGAGILYEDSSYLWLDAEEENGGRPWLDPYASPAVDYLASIAQEAAQMGVHQLVLSACTYPTAYGREQAVFASEDGGFHDEGLQAFLEAMEEAVGSDCGLSLYVPGADALGLNDNRYGVENPLALWDRVMLDLTPQGVQPALDAYLISVGPQAGMELFLEAFQAAVPVGMEGQAFCVLYQPEPEEEALQAQLEALQAAYGDSLVSYPSGQDA